MVLFHLPGPSICPKGHLCSVDPVGSLHRVPASEFGTSGRHLPARSQLPASLRGEAPGQRQQLAEGGSSGRAQAARRVFVGSFWSCLAGFLLARLFPFLSVFLFFLGGGSSTRCCFARLYLLVSARPLFFWPVSCLEGGRAAESKTVHDSCMLGYRPVFFRVRRRLQVPVKWDSALTSWLVNSFLNVGWFEGPGFHFTHMRRHLSLSGAETPGVVIRTHNCVCVTNKPIGSN